MSAKNDRSELFIAKLNAGATLQSIGDEYGITRERVRQIASKHPDYNSIDIRKLRIELKVQRLVKEYGLSISIMVGEGKTYTQIASELGLYWGLVVCIAKQVGLETIHHSLHHAKVIQMYQDGKLLREISGECFPGKPVKYCTAKVSRVLKRHGVDANRQAKDIDHAAMMADRECGMPINEIVEKYGYANYQSACAGISYARKKQAKSVNPLQELTV